MAIWKGSHNFAGIGDLRTMVVLNVLTTYKSWDDPPSETCCNGYVIGFRTPTCCRSLFAFQGSGSNCASWPSLKERHIAITSKTTPGDDCHHFNKPHGDDSHHWKHDDCHYFKGPSKCKKIPPPPQKKIKKNGHYILVLGENTSSHLGESHRQKPTISRNDPLARIASWKQREISSLQKPSY